MLSIAEDTYITDAHYVVRHYVEWFGVRTIAPALTPLMQPRQGEGIAHSLSHKTKTIKNLLRQSPQLSDQ